MLKKDSFALLVGKNVQRYRKAAGMTQAQLAERVGVSPAHLSRVERGDKQISISVLKMLSEIFAVSYDALLRDLPSNSAARNIDTLLEGHTEEYIRGIEGVIRACRKLPPE